MSIWWFLLDGPCTLPSVALEGLHLFDDEEVRQTFSDSMCIDPSDLVWQQAQPESEQGWSGASQCIITLISSIHVFLFDVKLCYQH